MWFKALSHAILAYSKIFCQVICLVFFNLYFYHSISCCWNWGLRWSTKWCLQVISKYGTLYWVKWGVSSQISHVASQVVSTLPFSPSGFHGVENSHGKIPSSSCNPTMQKFMCNELWNFRQAHLAFIIHIHDELHLPNVNCCCLIPHWPNDSPSFLPWVLFNTFPHLSLSIGGRISCHFVGMDLGGGFSARSMFFFHNPRCSWQTLSQFYNWACVGQHVRYVCAQCKHQSWHFPPPPPPRASYMLSGG